MLLFFLNGAVLLAAEVQKGGVQDTQGEALISAPLSFRVPGPLFSPTP